MPQPDGDSWRHSWDHARNERSAMMLHEPPAIYHYAQEIDRRNLADDIANFVFKHAERLEEDRTQYACDDAYELILTARQLYDLNRPIERVHRPISSAQRGCYGGWPPTKLDHDFLMFRIWLMLPLPAKADT